MNSAILHAAGIDPSSARLHRIEAKNEVFHVEGADGDCYVKCGVVDLAGKNWSRTMETQYYSARWEGLSDHGLPARAIDPATGTMVLPDGGFDWGMLAAQVDLPANHYRLAGSKLASIHAEGRKLMGSLQRILPQKTSGLFNLHLQPDARTGVDAVAAAIVLDDPLFAPLAERVKESFAQHAAFCHADYAWDNLLVDDPDSEAPRLSLIDWEYWCRADPAWDVVRFLSFGIRFAALQPSSQARQAEMDKNHAFVDAYAAGGQHQREALDRCADLFPFAFMRLMKPRRGEVPAAVRRILGRSLGIETCGDIVALAKQV